MNAKHELVRYLLERGLLSHAAVVDGDVTVVERARRHTNFTVLRQQGPGLFIKQMRPDQANSAQTLQKEAAFYGIIAGDPALADVHALMPRFHAYDPEAHLLIVELLAGAEDINEHHSRLGTFPVETARRIAAALARYQTASRRELASRPSGVMFARSPAWILSFHTFPDTALHGMSGANGQFMSILRGSTGFVQALEHLRATWQYETLIHADMKFENCMLTADGIRIVDWELADIGDPLWDAGSIIQAYLTWWISGMQIPPGTPLMLSATSSMFPLESIRPAIQAFWSEYASAMGFGAHERDAKLERTIAYAGARLLQTVYESSAYSQALAPHAMLEVQASMNMLSQPRVAAAELIGMQVHAHA
jgi:thiamine kinase-like enzyme